MEVLLQKGAEVLHSFFSLEEATEGPLGAGARDRTSVAGLGAIHSLDV